MDYRVAGVDVEGGRLFVDRIRQTVAKTRRPEVLGGLGGFAGFFQLPTGYQEPVLVAGTDGVGTKLKLARSLGLHETIGIDLVAMCVNDVLTCGAEPLFFLDYLATGALNPEQLAQVVVGIGEGCTRAGCSILGGETAEMPGFYQGDEYDLAGFCVGIVERSKILDGSRIEVGDRVIGLASSGVHSNGFSLVRKIVEVHGLSWHHCPDLLGEKSLGEVLLTPTEIYVKPILEALKAGLEVRGMAHITGGGLPENLPRCLGTGQGVKIKPGSWSIPPIFEWLRTMGNVSLEDMYETFNMGIGFAIIVPRDEVEATLKFFEGLSLKSYAIGEVIPGAGELIGLI